MTEKMPALMLNDFLNRPLMLSMEKANALRYMLQNGEKKANILSGREEMPWFLNLPYKVIEKTAIVTVSGILISGGGGGWSSSWATFYEDIRLSLYEILDNKSVEQIILWIDSPGGMVTGCFELADFIKKVSETKPVYSVIYGAACSAAYALASAADEITLPQTGCAGSVGVLSIHTDVSQMLQNAGIKTTIFKYGACKADLADTEPLSDGAIQREQAQINSLGEIFISLVVKNRGLPADAVRGLEAQTFMGTEAKNKGLVDYILPPYDAADAILSKTA